MLTLPFCMKLIKTILGKLFNTAFYAWGAFVALVLVVGIALGVYEYFFGKAPDYSQPHEYIKVTGYTSDGAQLDSLGNENFHAHGKNEYEGHGMDEIGPNFFHLGSGKCQSWLTRISDQKIWMYTHAYNLASLRRDPRGKAITQVKLECVEYLGINAECEQALKSLDIDALLILDGKLPSLTYQSWCRKERVISRPRTVRIDPRLYLLH